MTPSARLVADAEAAQAVQDAAGRVIAVRRLNALDKLRLFKAAGPILAQNHPWLGMALLACSVTAIDGVPYPIPANEQQIEAMIARLGDGGINAVAAAMQDEQRPVDEVAAGN